MSVVVRSQSRSGRWTPDPGYGVYLHTPFCLHRCSYCDFNTYEGKGHLQDAYVDALLTEIHRSDADGGPATSVYFGGGTPTLLAPGQLGDLLDAVSQHVGLAPGAEVTVEANPETVDERVFESLLARGFNRFSLGIQSLSDRVLAALDRKHNADVALAALRAAHDAGAEDVNADIIYGSPWEREDDLRRTCELVLDESCSHISAYALTVEEGTPLHTLVSRGRAPDVDPDLQGERADLVDSLLRSAGFGRYEISNWSRPGHASAHNVLYWCGGDYLGLGAGAHGHAGGRRSWSVRRPEEFIDVVTTGGTTEAGHETLARTERAREAAVLGLRLLSGIEESSFRDRFAPDDGLQDALDGAAEAGLLERVDGWLRLTRRGREMASEVARRLL